MGSTLGRGMGILRAREAEQAAYAVGGDICDTGDSRIKGAARPRKRHMRPPEEGSSQGCAKSGEGVHDCGRAMKYPTPPREFASGLNNGGVRDWFRGEGSAKPGTRGVWSTGAIISRSCMCPGQNEGSRPTGRFPG